MKKIYVAAFASLLLTQSYAQDFQGFRTSKYSGVNGVFFNPANTAGSPYRFDANILSFSTTVANDQASFKLSTISETFKGDSIKNQLFGKNAGASSGVINLDFHGPSVMFNIGKKNAIALTTRARLFANVTDVDGKLFDKISEDFTNDPSLPYTISSKEKMRISANGWSEFGLSYGRVIKDEVAHHFKAGITVKYLAGAGNAYMNIDNFNGTIDENIIENAYLQNTTGRIATGFGGINFSDFKADDLMNFESSGFGADLGVVYEYHPGNSKDYKLKVGVAVLDLGSIKYEKDMQRSGAYDINITGNKKFKLNELDGVEFDNINNFFASHPNYFTPAGDNSETSYKVSLPTTLQIDADYHVASGFYVNLASQVSMSNNNSKVFNNKTYSSVTFTPRFETKQFGAYIPLNYNQLSKFNAGASFRFGPLFIGSGSILSALVGHSKQLDGHIGVRFGGLK
jgi:hypothetical protein